MTEPSAVSPLSLPSPPPLPTGRHAPSSSDQHQQEEQKHARDDHQTETERRVGGEGPRLSLLEPLHWSVYEIAEEGLGENGQQRAIPIRGAIFNLDAGATQLNLMLYINTPNVGQREWPLTSICAPQTFENGKCEFSLGVPTAVLVGAGDLAKGTFVLALRLVSPSNYQVSVGPVSEVTFRVQPKFTGPWGESSCWHGFFQHAPPPHSACLADPYATPVAATASSAPRLASWLASLGVEAGAAARHAQDAAAVAGLCNQSLAATVCQWLRLRLPVDAGCWAREGTPPGGDWDGAGGVCPQRWHGVADAVGESIQDASVRQSLSLDSWYPTSWSWLLGARYRAPTERGLNASAWRGHVCAAGDGPVARVIGIRAGGASEPC